MGWMLIKLCVFLSWSVLGVSAAECQDVAVVVVASVFGTLAVVLIVLGIVGFLLWKRRRGILKPEKHKDEPDRKLENYGYANPAFDKDPELGDAASQDESGFKTNGSNKPIFAADKNKKTWASLPSSDTQFARARKNSTGSLDRNTNYGPAPCLRLRRFSVDDDLVSVCLTSQDFIGLGFNVAGSMRDGIYVSQVHNRGPAKESGKFKFGDRILSVAISFENMVYEDALTILSYASPYPVKVTLQKQTEIPKHRKLSELRTSLNHPLYRSQSVDTLQNIGKEPLFQPKRSNSEVRHEGSPRSKRISKGGSEGNIMEETSAFLNSADNEVFSKAKSVSQADVTVHRETGGKGSLGIEREVSIPVETDIPSASLDLNAELAQSNPYFATNTTLADPFQNLTEEDKLDVIRLSYDDPENFSPRSIQSLETEISPPSPGFGEHKVIPMKPERKKKRGSTASGTSLSDGELTDGPSAPSSPVPIYDDALVDEVISPSLMPPTEAPPPVPDDEQEAEEEIVQPVVRERTVSIDTDKITFEPVDLSILNSSETTIKADTSLNDSFSDNDVTLIKPPSPFTRSDSQEGEAVEEETVSATQVKRDTGLPDVNKYGNNAGEKGSSSSSLSSSDSDTESKKLEIENVEKNITVQSVVVTEPAPGIQKENGDTVTTDENDFDKGFPDLDMNLGFDADSVLFQEKFPSRNEKEKDGGIAFDISVTELEAMEKKAKAEEEERTKNENQIGKGGIAFEVREDYVTGQTRTVNANSVHRTASYEIRSDTDKLKDYEISTQRPTSLKTEIKTRNELESGKLDWSGQRLVRSGSFSDIPQDDSIKDWTTQQNLSVDDDIIEKHIQEDSKSPILKKLTKATLITGNQNVADLSDSDSNCRSLSSSSSESGGSSPTRDTKIHHTNGDDDGLGTSPETTPIKVAPLDNNNKTELIQTVAKFGDNDQAFTVTLNKSVDSGEEDC